MDSISHFLATLANTTEEVFLHSTIPTYMHTLTIIHITDSWLVHITDYTNSLFFGSVNTNCLTREAEILRGGLHYSS